jgi:hypothetical protein
VIPILTWLTVHHVGYVASFYHLYPFVLTCNIFAVLGALFVVQAAQPNSSLWAHTTLNFSVPYFSISMGLNVLPTSMLVTRLFHMRHKIVKALGSRHGKTYTNIAAMILESATPYGIISFIFLVLYTTNNTAALLFIPLLVQVQVGDFSRKIMIIRLTLIPQCISPILIILRVARGRAWTKDTISNSNLSRFKSGKGAGPIINPNMVINTMGDGDSHQDASLGTFKVSFNPDYSKELNTVDTVLFFCQLDGTVNLHCMSIDVHVYI